jgi:hypothetical protein
VKKPKLLLAVLALLIGAASAAGLKVPAGPDNQGERAMLQLQSKGGS